LEFLELASAKDSALRSYLVSPVSKFTSPDKNSPNFQVILSPRTCVASESSGATSRVRAVVGIS